MIRLGHWSFAWYLLHEKHPARASAAGSGGRAYADGSARPGQAAGGAVVAGRK